MDEMNVFTAIGFLTTIGVIIALIIKIIRSILFIYSLLKKFVQGFFSNSKQRKIDLTIQNRPRNVRNNFPHNNERNKKHNQYPEYFE